MGVVSKKEVGECKTAFNAALNRLKPAINAAKLGMFRGSQEVVTENGQSDLLTRTTSQARTKIKH